MSADEPKPEGKAADPAKPIPDAKAPESPTKATKPRRTWRNTVIFALSIVGVLAGLVGAYVFGLERKAQPPVFQPVSSPYETAIYANGIIESDQTSGENMNIFPEVTGPITRIGVHEGQQVSAGDLLFTIDDSVQRATTEQLRLQSEAACAVLEELKAQPRPETLAVAKVQVDQAESNLKAAQDPYNKDFAAYTNDPKSISRDVVDTAKDAVDQAASTLAVARKQYDLTKAGAWSYDIANQQKQYESLKQAYQSASALLHKYSVKASVNGVVLTVNATVGGYVSSQGVYESDTQLFDPLIVMGSPQDHLAVRCYVDEILVSRLPAPDRIRAQMSLRGTDVKVALEFVRVQPYVSPKIELANERQEQVDLRVLPVIFRFSKQAAAVYPGQLVDVYIGQTP
jgi:HlyD family secretion protein